MSVSGTRLGRLASVVVLATVAVGCGAGSDPDVEAAAETEQTVAVASPTATQPPETDDSVDAPAVLEADATPLLQEFGLVEVGTYRVDSLGTPFTFSNDERLFVQANSNGWTVLTAPSSRFPDDRDIVMMRVSALSDPSSPTTAFTSFEGGWPATDVDGWLDGLHGGVIVSNQHATTLGGFDAVRMDVELGDIECASASCAYFATNNLRAVKGMQPGSSYRIWVVDQGAEAPIAVIVGIDDDQEREWFDTADRLLATVAFGEVAPNPVVVHPAGPTDLPLLGGVRIDLVEPVVVLNDTRGFSKVPLGLEPGEVGFLESPLDSDGVLIASIDNLVEFLAGLSVVDLTELDSSTVGGFEARVFDIESRGQAEIKLLPDADIGWFSPPFGRLWILDHPDRGLLIIAADSASNEVLVQAIASVEGMLASLEFIEFG